MITLEIGDKSVQVEDSFLKLDPVQQNATVEEIAKSIGAKAPPQPENSLAGSAKAVGAGIAEGAASLAGLPADAADLAARGVDYVGGTNLGEITAPLAQKYGSQGIKSKIEEYTGELPKPQTGTEKFIHTAASFLPAAVAGPGGVGRRILTQAIAPGLASEAAGQLTEGTSYEPVARVAGALTGAIGASKAANAFGASRAAKGSAIAPTTEAIRAENAALYNTKAIQDLRVSKSAGEDVADRIAQKLRKDYFDADPVYNTLKNFKDSGPSAGVSYGVKDFDNLRRRLNDLRGQGGSVGEAARRSVEYLDNVMPHFGKLRGAVVAGDARAAASDIRTARANAATAFRSEKVDQWIERAVNTATATHSGGNLENEIYRQIRNALNNQKRDLKGWNAQEIKALREVLPDFKAKVNRRVGKLLGGGGGLGQLATIAAGTSAFGPVGLALPAIGQASNMLGSSMAQKRLQALSELIRSRAPGFAPQLAARNSAIAASQLPGPSMPMMGLQGLLAARQPY